MRKGLHVFFLALIVSSALLTSACVKKKTLVKGAVVAAVSSGISMANDAFGITNKLKKAKLNPFRKKKKNRVSVTTQVVASCDDDHEPPATEPPAEEESAAEQIATGAGDIVSGIGSIIDKYV